MGHASHYAADQGGFPGAIGADQGMDGTMSYCKIYLIQNFIATQGNGKITDFQEIGISGVVIFLLLHIKTSMAGPEWPDMTR